MTVQHSWWDWAQLLLQLGRLKVHSVHLIHEISGKVYNVTMLDKQMNAKVQGTIVLNCLCSVASLFLISKSSVLGHGMESLIALFNLFYSALLGAYFNLKLLKVNIKTLYFWLFSSHGISLIVLVYVCLSVSYAINKYLIFAEALGLATCFGFTVYLLKKDLGKLDEDETFRQNKGVNTNVIVVATFVGVFCSGWLLLAFGADGLVIILSFLFSLSSCSYLGVLLVDYFYSLKKNGISDGNYR